jgi:phosphate transport system substrate-binding protein
MRPGIPLAFQKDGEHDVNISTATAHGQHGGRRRRVGALKAGSLLLVAGLVLAACSSGPSHPEASKKAKQANHHDAKSAVKKADPTTTTTVAPTTTTTTKPTVVAAHSVTPTTVKPSTPTTVAAPSTPGGSLSANPTTSPAESLTGVGASSIQPFYGRVLYQYNALNKGVSVNYSPAGSGPGVTAIEQNTANFGQSEIPMTAAQLAASQGAVLQVPVDLGGVAISYNESCAGANLQLTGAQLAQIYLRQITNWNQLAPACPTSDNIVPVFRSDTSGPGYDLDQYLIDTSPAWTSAIGTTSASTTWPNAGRGSGTSGEQLNAGVATYIQQTQGAIGYVEYSYALEANFTNAALQSHDGTFVSPSITTIANAGAQATSLSPTNFNIVWGSGGQTYPLANYSWALMYQKQSNTNIGIVLGKLFQWVTTAGQSYSTGLGYAPLPAYAANQAHATLLGLQTSSGQPIFTN